jgi:hypothetical protein
VNDAIKCVEFGVPLLSSMSGWRFHITGGMGGVAKYISGLFIRSDITLLMTLYDWKNSEAGSVMIHNPPEYFRVQSNGWAINEDCHHVWADYDPYARCKMELIVVDILTLWGVVCEGPCPDFFQGPGGSSSTTGDVGKNTPTSVPHNDTYGLWRTDPAGYYPPEFEAVDVKDSLQVTGYTGSLHYRMAPAHCKVPPSAWPWDPLPPDNGGGTPTPPSGGGTPTLQDEDSVRESVVPSTVRAW